VHTAVLWQALDGWASVGSRPGCAGEAYRAVQRLERGRRPRSDRVAEYRACGDLHLGESSTHHWFGASTVMRCRDRANDVEATRRRGVEG
jgi:hypothetical protein